LNIISLNKGITEDIEHIANNNFYRKDIYKMWQSRIRMRMKRKNLEIA